MPKRILGRPIYTMSELAEDAGHMGYTHDYYPGSEKWMREHGKVKLVDVSPACSQGELFDTSKLQ